jgi:hypothetical protein
MRSITEIVVTDPDKYIEASLATLRAMKEGTGGVNIYKEVKIEPGAQTYEGLKFTRVEMTMDVEELAKLSGNVPGQADMLKEMFGDGKMGHWYGTDGKRLVQIVAMKWEDAKAQLDAYFSGKDSVGRTPGFKAARSELSERASFLMLISAQGLTRMMARQFSAMTRNPNLKPPDDMPKEPAFLGGALTPHPSEGYEFQLVIPSAFGTVIAKDTIPMFQGQAPRPVNQ